jgi:uncharacterized protein (DUF302 family)
MSDTSPDNGIIRLPAASSVDAIVEFLTTTLHTGGITLFSLIDHSGEAHKAGFTMPPTRLLIFGNPKGGTPVMLASPSSALDLPLKILVAEDAAGHTWVSYNATEYLAHRHNIPADLAANLKAVEVLATRAAHFTAQV